MIDKAKLEALDMVTLSQLRDATNAVLERKMKQAARSGGFEVTLDDERRPGVRVKVTGYGPRNLTGHEINKDGIQLFNRKWRVNPKFATVVPNFKAEPIKLGRPTYRGEDAPASGVPAF